MIGRALGGDTTARAGDAYGTALLIVDLTDDDTLAFDGDLTLANAVRATYATSVARETLNSRTLTPWLGRILRTRHGAVKRGHTWYVPPGHAHAVRALIGGPVYAAGVKAWAESGGKDGALPMFDRGSLGNLWGDHELMSVNTGGDLLTSLTRGLSNDVAAIERDLATATEAAKGAARKQAEKTAAKTYKATAEYIAAEGDAAYKRGQVSSTVAARFLRDLGTIAARVSGYKLVIGGDHTDAINAQIATLRETLGKLTDDTSARFAMLDLDGGEA